MGIQFVGGTAVSNIGTAATYAVSLTGLTGGIASAPTAGDVILVLTGWASTTDGTPGVSTAGYTEITELYVNATSDANLSASYLVVGATPPTSVTVFGTTSAANSKATVVAVFRGVDNTTPLDVASTTYTSSGNVLPNFAAITPVSTYAASVVMFFTAYNSSLSLALSTPPTGYTACGSFTSPSGTQWLLGGIAWKGKLAAGTIEDPTYWSVVNGTAAAFSVAGVTVALRPDANGLGNAKVWNGSAWLPKPVKAWNGTSWVKKPVKFWNGANWVLTNY